VRYEFRIGDREVALDVASGREGYAVSWDGREQRPEILHAAGAQLDFRLGGRRHRAWIAARGDERHVFLDGRTFTFRLSADEDAGEADTAAAGPNVAAQMPGKVVKLLVGLGQEVAVGTGLLIVESMKMETEIAAPVAGTVSAVHVADGQVVGMGEPLLDIEPAAE
jgi:acetyl/propionyl-CoA carboxylase alpha subunit